MSFVKGVWNEVRVAASETPRLYFGTVMDVAHAFGRLVHGAPTPPLKKGLPAKKAAWSTPNLPLKKARYLSAKKRHPPK